MTPIDVKLIKKFIKIAVEKLEGEWVIIGGTVLPILKIDHRVTVDIDIVAKGQRTNAQDSLLMQIAEDIGLPIEVINQAGHYFLHKIKNWENQLVLVDEGRKAKIYRPNATLFLLLKMKRLTESDLADCLQMLKYAKKNQPEEINKKLLIQSLEKIMQATEIDKEVNKRYKILYDSIT